MTAQRVGEILILSGSAGLFISVVGLYLYIRTRGGRT